MYIGIDPTCGHKSFTYAALDRELNLLTLEDGELDDLVVNCSSQKSVIAAINAPSGVNHGLVRERMKSEMRAPHQIRGAEMRLCEYELRQRGIVFSGTPSSVRLSPAWMQMGFKLYHELENTGFVNYADKKHPYQFLETNPHASFCVMIGSVPHSKTSLEGRLQRQLTLYEHGMRIRDPMDFFEEVTRFKIIKGNWPIELLYQPEELDALSAAYTAWAVANKAENVLAVGVRSEGRIYLPVSELKEAY